MFKKSVQYTDFDGNPQVEDVYFNLSSPELMAMEMEIPGGLAAKIEAVSKAKDGNGVMETFLYMLEKSYGQKSEDGKRFIKSEQLWNEFKETAVYDALFMSLVLDANVAAEFMNNVIPADLTVRLEAALAAQEADRLRAVAAEVPGAEILTGATQPPAYPPTPPAEFTLPPPAVPNPPAADAGLE